MSPLRIRGIKLIIFDLDGTLVDAYRAITGSFNYTMQKLNYPGQRGAVIRRAVGLGDKNLLKPFVKPKDLKEALSVYRRHHKNALLLGSRLFPGAARVLDYFKKRGFRLAIASNRPTLFSRILIRRLGIEGYFDYILCADRLKYAKPHPQIINNIIRRFTVSPDETLYVGDMAIDAEAGRRAGVKTIIVTTGSSSAKEIKKEKPYRVIGRIRELSKMVRSNPKK